jgi:hypothetical protein
MGLFFKERAMSNYSTYDAHTPGAPILGDLSRRQEVILWDHIRGLEELLDYALSHAGDMDKEIVHGFASRIEALRDDLAGGLPSDPRIRPFKFWGPAVT